jgi:hypothetical protein
VGRRISAAISKQQMAKPSAAAAAAGAADTDVIAARDQDARGVTAQVLGAAAADVAVDHHLLAAAIQTQVSQLRLLLASTWGLSSATNVQQAVVYLISISDCRQPLHSSRQQLECCWMAFYFQITNALRHYICSSRSVFLGQALLQQSQPASRGQ